MTEASQSTRAAWSTLLGATAALTLSAGCTALNSFDEVVSSEGGSAGSGGSGGAGGDAGAGGSGGSGAGGAGGSMGGVGGDGGQLDAGPPLVLGPLIAVGGVRFDQDGSGTRVLALIEAETGETLSVEPMDVAALAFDARAELWYVFVADAFPADQSSPVDMLVRRWDGETWQTLSTVPAIPPPRPDGVAVLNGRLAYLSWRIGPDDRPIQQLTLLDTSSPGAITAITIPSEVTDPINFDNAVVDLVGTPGRPNDPAALGGDLTLLMADACAPGDADCNLVGQPIAVGASISRGVPKTVTRFTGTGVVAEGGATDSALIVSQSPLTGNASLTRINSRSLDVLGLEVATTSTARDFVGIGYDDCLNSGIFAESSDDVTEDGTSLFAVSLGNALGNRMALGQQRTGVYYEPATHTLLVPYRGGEPVVADGGMFNSAPDLVAYRVSSNGTSVSLSELDESEWQPPPRLLGQTAAMRPPRGFSCP